MTAHILLYTDDYGLGGVAQYNHSLLLALRDVKYEVSCVRTRSENPLYQKEAAAGVNHVWLDYDTVADFDKTVQDFDGNYRLFQAQQPDLILFSDSCPTSNFAAKMAALALKIPYVVVVGFVAPYLAERMSNLLDGLQQQYAGALSVIAVSQENLDLLHQLFRLAPDKGEVIYYGRPPSYFAPQDRAVRDRLRRQIGIPDDAILCFTAARLEPVKGFQFQIEAIAQLKATPLWERLYFVWAGEGSYRAELEANIQYLGVGDRVLLLGQRWDVADWLNAADIFVFPTVYEGMPLAVMEAMAKGVPVVASAVSGIPEELGDTGKLLTPPMENSGATVAELVKTIQLWATNADLRRAVGMSVRQRAVLMFREERMVRETMTAIEQALLPEGDYVSPGFAVVRPDAAFPNMIVADPRTSSWSYLRREIPHNWYVDARSPVVGFLSRDEAHILYNTALQFKGQQALEIGCWLGWSACHLALAGVHLDVIDPLLEREDFYESVSQSLSAAGVSDRVKLLPGFSPAKVEELATEQKHQWSLIFIDGNHDAPGPLQDAIACEKLAAADALVLFHDLASPEVAEGLDYFRQQGWNTMVYQTMQIMGVAWRGNVQPIEHQPDPDVAWVLPDHLAPYPVSGMNFTAQQSQISMPQAVTHGVETLNTTSQLFNEFLGLLDIVRPYSLLSSKRLFSLYSLAKQICVDDLPGNFVECGTCRGGSAALLAWVIKNYSKRPRLLYACDTFEGMPEPTEIDAHQGIPANDTGYGVGTLAAPIHENLAVISETLGVYDAVVPVKGLFGDTLPQYRAEMGAIALLHADGDWYESTMDIFNTLYDSVVPNGFVQIDDYGFWEGCRVAIHDFEQQRGESFELHGIDSTGVWFQKRNTIPPALLPSPAETIDRYRLRDYNLLAFPDWEQPEEELFESLSQLLQGIFLHPQRTRITLLLDATGVDPEPADWAISSVVMHLLEQTDVEPEGAPEIVLLSDMESDPTKGEAPLQRWRILLPFVAARVVLQRENSMVEVCAEAGTLTSCPVETLLEANLQTFRLAQEAEIKAQVGKGLADANTLPYLLAALQYFYPHEVEWTFDLPSVPPWLLKPLMEYWLATPPIFHRVGESADYLHFVQKLTAYLHKEILQNQRSPFWQEIAEFFILRLHLIPLYFNQEDLRSLYRQRAEILEAVLTHQGTSIDHAFGGRGDRHKIRLGVLAAHFYPETETFATLPVFQHLDRQKFEVILYSIEPFNHRLAQHCTRQVDSVVELPRTTDGRVARIREDDLDILFIASNVTAVTNWVTLVAPHRMARLQVVGMNSPVSTEMTHIDYYLSSGLTNPSFDVQRHYRETVVQLDGPAQCFDFATEAQPAPTQKLSREVLGIAPDAVVFVSGANFHKITPELESTWAKIIAGVPNAVLLLYPFNISWSSEYPEAAFRDRLAASFACEGVSADRFLLLPNAPNRGDVLERLKLADVYLDSHPFSGMTSLVDPLQLGLPTIVMELDLPVSLARGSAFLRDLGIPELIVESEAEYVQLAIALGTQPERRKELCDRILQGMAKAPGFLDSRRYSEEMSRVFESLFEAYQTEAYQTKANQQPAPATAPAAQPKTVASQPSLLVNQPIARPSMRGALLQINRLGFEPATVIDVGAALGTFDLYDLFPQSRHILIEPIAENEPYLAKICKKLGNAEYHIAAAASEPGTLTLSVNPGLVNSSLVTAGDTTPPISEMRTVKVVSLDQLCRDRNLQPPFLVKVDVDGKEMEVLKGAVQVLEATEYLIIESTCFGQMNEVVDFMREHGFAIYDIVDPVYRPGDHALWQVDLAFVKRSGQFRQSHSYVEASSDGINQQQVWEHHHRYRAQLIDYIEHHYGEADGSASEISTDLGFTPKPITWIAFPDWQQPEETLFDDLTQVVRRVLKAGDRQQHMLLLDASSIDSDDANLMLADAVMYLLQDEGLEVDEDGPEIVLLPEINSTQWQQLGPALSARVKLAHEGSAARLNLAVDLPVVELEPR